MLIRMQNVRLSSFAAKAPCLQFTFRAITWLYCKELPFLRTHLIRTIFGKVAKPGEADANATLRTLSFCRSKTCSDIFFRGLRYQRVYRKPTLFTSGGIVLRFLNLDWPSGRCTEPAQKAIQKIDENTEERENAPPLLVSSAVPLVDQKVRIPC